MKAAHLLLLCIGAILKVFNSGGSDLLPWRILSMTAMQVAVSSRQSRRYLIGMVFFELLSHVYCEYSFNVTISFF